MSPGGYFDISEGCEDSFHAVHEAIHSLGQSYTHDRLIAKLTLGFWRYQFANKEFAASGSILLETFPFRPHGTRQKIIVQMLTKVNEIRNRIAHHEPICFEKNIISIDRTERRYYLILELLSWMGCNVKRLLAGIDFVPESIAAARKAKPS